MKQHGRDNLGKAAHLFSSHGLLYDALDKTNSQAYHRFQSYPDPELVAAMLQAATFWQLPSVETAPLQLAADHVLAGSN